MMARHRAIATGVLLSFIGHMSPTAARGSQVAADPHGIPSISPNCPEK
jgi:hypothetical protein